MIDTQSLLSFLSLPQFDINLNNYLANNQIQLDQELALGVDEYRAYIERPLNGFCLVFTDESYFFGYDNAAIGSGNLYFSGAFFYSEGKDNYTEYDKDLPFGLSFKDVRQDVLAKLGQQSWQRLAKDGKRVIADRWDALPNVPYRLHVTYDGQTGKISILSASIPDKPLSHSGIQ